MTNVRDYLRTFDPAREKLETFLERVQREVYQEAYQAGFKSAASKMFEIAAQTTAKVDRLTHEALTN